MAFPDLKNSIQYLIMMKAWPFMIAIHLSGNSVVNVI